MIQTKNNWLLGVLLALYCIIGTLYALRVPAWQVPDEPAHYNYVRQLVQNNMLPVIENGDFDPKLVPLPPKFDHRPVDKITYEDHQPPLFYALAAPVFALSGGNLVAMRLLSVLLGGAGVVCCYLTLQRLFPTTPHWAALGTAFYALLPQHVHILAGFNNDSLSEALIALTVLLCVGLITQTTPRPAPFLGIGLAVVVGLALLTKAQAYLALPLAVLGLWLARPSGATTRNLLVVPMLACILGLPLWVRNIGLYGGTDFLGLQRHDLVVVGQLTTAEMIAKAGAGAWLRELLQTTFQSYWGQFGWMSVPLSNRYYIAFLAFTLCSAVLFMRWWLRDQSTPATPTPAPQRRALTLLAALALMTLLAFVWYNTKFVQFQGRYLYPALVPVAAALAVGWNSALPKLSRWLWLPFALGLVALDIYLLFRVIVPNMT